MKTHMRQSSNCVFVQELNITFKKTLIIISIIALIKSTSIKFVSINDIAFSSQRLYLIIENLYHKQQILLAKIENLTIIETEKIAIVVQEVIESKIDVVVNSELKTKIKSFKFEKFTINFNSTSTISNLESIIKSNVALVASSIFISISENSKLNSLRSISFCSTSTLLLINQSNRSLVVNIMFFVSYNKRLATFKK